MTTNAFCPVGKNQFEINKTELKVAPRDVVLVALDKFFLTRNMFDYSVVLILDIIILTAPCISKSYIKINFHGASKLFLKTFKAFIKPL